MHRPSWATFSNGRRAPGASPRLRRCRCSTAAAARPASRTRAASSTSRWRATASRCSSPSRTSRTSSPRCACWPSSPRRRIAPSLRPGVREAVTVQALVVPPIGEAAFLRRRRNGFHRARFDLALLIETDSVERAEALRASTSFRALETDVRENAGHVYVVTASNAKRIGTVDHTRGGVFLFGYFYADSPAQNLAAWEQTAV